MSEDAKNFDAARDRLATKLCDPANSAAYLDDKPWTPIGEWALVYAVETETPDGDLDYTIVDNEMLQTWGVDAETLHRETVAAEYKRNPPWFGGLFASWAAGHGEEADNLLEHGELLHYTPEDVFVLSNGDRNNGAGALGHDGIMERIAELLDADYYVIPVSVHEVMIVADQGTQTADVLQRMLVEANGDPDMVHPDDVLSHRIQKYSRAEGRLGNPS